MEPGLVTIAIVAYNNWPDLELAIQSALCQSYRSIEILVIDNSSTDSTAEEVRRRFGDKVQYIQQPNTRDSGAYNTGLRAGKGEFFQVLDGDDLFAPNKIEKQLEVFRADPTTDVVYGEVRCFQTLDGAAAWDDLPVPDHRQDLLRELLIPGHGVIFLFGCLFRRSALERVGFFDESLYVTDMDYVLRALWAGCHFRYCPGNPIGFYRIRPGQMSSNRYEMARGFDAVYAKALTYVDREPYRTLVRTDLAWIRFLTAVKGYDLTKRESLRTLGEARTTDPRIVSIRLYIAGLIVILIPGARIIARSEGFRQFRRKIARLLGFAVPG